MACDPISPEDAAALSARRERARAVAGRIAQAVEAMPMPRTFFDAERAVRPITVADRMLVRLPDPHGEGGISPARQRLRVFSDRILAAIEGLPMPETFRDAERASRCVLATDTLLTQLYTPPKAAKRARAGAFDPAALDDEPETPDSCEDSAKDRAGVTAALFDRLDIVALAYARETGFYPDGTACDPAGPAAPEHLACPEEIDIIDQWMNETRGKPFVESEGLLPLARIMTGRANGSVRAQARHSGQWPDGRAFKDTDPPFFVLSKRFDVEVLKRPGPDHSHVHEDPGPELFPWWLVRNPDTG
jgi:hypothetical protein